MAYATPAPYETVQSVDSTSGGFTATGESAADLKTRLMAGSGWSMLVQPKTGGVRWRIDGTAPTTSVGFVCPADGSFTVEGAGNIYAFRMIRDGGTTATTTTMLTAKGA